MSFDVQGYIDSFAAMPDDVVDEFAAGLWVTSVLLKGAPYTLTSSGNSQMCARARILSASLSF